MTAITTISVTLSTIRLSAEEIDKAAAVEAVEEALSERYPEARIDVAALSIHEHAFEIDLDDERHCAVRGDEEHGDVMRLVEHTLDGLLG